MNTAYTMNMDSSAILGIVAVAISVLALCMSTLLSARQVRLMRNANHVPVVFELISEFRSKQFHDDYEFVTTRLRAEHEPELGISGLPGPAKASAWNIAYYYQVVAFIIGFGILDDREIFAVLRLRIIKSWDELAPFIAVERTKTGVPILTMFETLAQQARRAPVYTPRRFGGFNRKHNFLQHNLLHAASVAHFRQLASDQARKAASSSNDDSSTPRAAPGAL